MLLKNLARLLLVLTANAALCASQNHAYDGAWWQATGRDRHLGWLAGYIVCTSEPAKKAFTGFSEYTLEPKVTDFYSSRPNAINLKVSAVVLKLIRARAVTPQNQAGGEHAGFDGEYWRQVPRERVGIVEGFLACHQEFEIEKGSFSKPASRYAAQISRWYGVDPNDPAVINLRRVSVPIEKVLLRFKDRPHGPGD